jgi:hypothetical protein
MALFARRTIQRLLHENACFTLKAQAEAQVRALNLANEQSIATEWEIAVLNAFSKLGTVQHEPDLGAGHKADLLFFPEEGTGAGFVADIATVFETGRNEKNPIEYIRNELIRRLRGMQLEPNKFSYRVQGELRGKAARRVMKLKLPAKKDVVELFDAEFMQFLRACKSKPHQEHHFRRCTDNVDMTVGYDPAQRYFSGSHPPYTTSYSLTRNPIHNALARKADQLRDVGSPLPRGVILCAADCHLNPDRGRFGASTIIQHFLRQNSSVVFVLVLSAREDFHPIRGFSKPYVTSQLYLSETVLAIQLLGESIIRCLNSAHILMWLYSSGHTETRTSRSIRGVFDEPTHHEKISR